ncbi:hypothetical protein JCM11251_004229 [Rhodosporidiobolus azoricus]
MHHILSLVVLASTAFASPLTQLPFIRPTSSSLCTDAPRSVLQHAHRVNLQLGVMSRCPDAHLCEAVFERVLETQVEVYFDVVVAGGEEGEEGGGNETRREKKRVEVRELVDLSTVYIARENTTSKEYGVTCMHGELECRGNVQQLCARKYWAELKEEPEAHFGEHGNTEATRAEKQTWEDWWNFIQCINYGETASIGTEHKAKECARIVRREWSDDLTRCTAPTTRSEGSQLLLSSVREAKKLGVQKSCTILIEGKKVCIHDSTWQSCPAGHQPAEFAKQIKEEWEKLNGASGK